MAETVPLNIEREALTKALGSPHIRANAEWCVACGAGASAGPDLPRVFEQQISKDPEILKELTRADYVREVATKLSSADLNADWCVACGAGAAAAPDIRVFPQLSDADIEAIAARVLPALKK